MREQTGLGMRNQTGTYRLGQEIAPSAGHAPENVPQQTDDRQTGSMRREYLSDERAEPQPSPSSTRRYATAIQRATPRSLIQVTDHRGQPIQRASRLRQPYTEQEDEPETPVPRRDFVRQRKPRKPWMFYAGVLLSIAIVGGILLNMAANWVHVTLDDWHYGRPRTFQTDADVGHGGVSHFIVENVGGRIIVYELPNHDVSKAKIYAGPTLVGDGDPELIPVTLTFRDVNGDGLVDLIFVVNGNPYTTFLNGKDGMFHPPS